jgi:hypothetical protein
MLADSLTSAEFWSIRDYPAFGCLWGHWTIDDLVTVSTP